jgi:hypothetical protein
MIVFYFELAITYAFLNENELPAGRALFIKPVCKHCLKQVFINQFLNAWETILFLIQVAVLGKVNFAED